MTRILLTLPALALACTVSLLSGTQPQDSDLRSRQPVALALVDDDKTLLIANRGSGTISVLDSETLRVVKEIRVGRKLSHLTSSGNLVLVTDEAAGELVILEYQKKSLHEKRRLKTGMTPVSVQISDDRRLATVACLWPRRLQIVDLAAPERTSVIDLPFAPRCQLLIPGRNKLLVADSFGGQLALIDVQSRELESVRSLHVHNIRHLALANDGASLLFTHQVLYRQGQPTAGDIRSGNLIGNHVRRLTLSSVLNPRADALRDEQLYTLGDVERGAGDPTAVAESADGAILVTLAGTNELALGRPERAIWTRLDMGERPTSLVLDAKRRRAYVANMFADSVSVVDLQQTKVIAEVDLAAASQRPRDLAPAERGERLFYDARLSLDGWYSCHSCHTDGHSNGRLNDNFSDGSFGTPKRVLSLLGTTDTGPWAWNGRMTELESQVRNSLRSTMQGPTPTPERVRDLTAYLHTLPAPPPLAQARGQCDEAAVERGRKVFEERKCAACHTTPTFTSPRTYDVGLRDEAGETQFNPPSLRGLSQAGPFFHDNRALTTEEVLGRYRHRLPEELSVTEMRDLLAYLASL